MHRSTSFLVLLALGVGFVLFKVKYEVVEIEEKFSKTRAQIRREEDTIHILKAEWSHLNEPQRLQSLAEKYLDIGPTKTQQVLALFNPTRSPPEETTHVQLASQKEAP